ncbi:MAG: TIGR02710 family CRISPR-associated protein [Acidobacteria bacterium]|nr:TIGR02710 family CRISPR-associated protein [Acidobacteriota bacterium]
MNEIVLICTVGGSHQPILTAIHETSPAFVCFLCTDKDPVTGQPGSRVQVEGKGSVIKARLTDLGPNLPNMAIQCGLSPQQYEVRIVPSDDLDGVVSEAARAMLDLRRRFPEARLSADYTGGTKTMTAGLVIAALEIEDVELRLVTGARGNLVQVQDGTQHSTSAIVETVRLRRVMAPFLNAWARYGYAEAAQGLARVRAPLHVSLFAELQIACDLSTAFDAWDRFDHAAALSTLRVYRPRIGARAGHHLSFLEILASSDGDPRKEPARLMDLWMNALRRADQGRYDDAVARGYRLLEWTAQWLLREYAGIDTADLPVDTAESLMIQPNPKGRRQAGLFKAWELVASHLSDAPQRFAASERNQMRDHLSARNASILAHGYTPIGFDAWNRFSGWLEKAFLPMLSSAAAQRGLRVMPPQLPTKPIWEG